MVTRHRVPGAGLTEADVGGGEDGQQMVLLGVMWPMTLRSGGTRVSAGPGCATQLWWPASGNVQESAQRLVSGSRIDAASVVRYAAT